MAARLLGVYVRWFAVGPDDAVCVRLSKTHAAARSEMTLTTSRGGNAAGLDRLRARTACVSGGARTAAGRLPIRQLAAHAGCDQRRMRSCMPRDTAATIAPSADRVTHARAFDRLQATHATSCSAAVPRKVTGATKDESSHVSACAAGRVTASQRCAIVARRAMRRAVARSELTRARIRAPSGLAGFDSKRVITQRPRAIRLLARSARVCSSRFLVQ